MAKTKFRPLHDRVVVERIDAEAKNITGARSPALTNLMSLLKIMADSVDRRRRDYQIRGTLTARSRPRRQNVRIERTMRLVAAAS